MPEETCKELLEKLARGRITKEPTILSKCYIDFVAREFNKHGCSISGRVLMSKLRECLESKLIDVNVFNKVLWNEIEELEF